MPRADFALKISKILNMSLESLLEGESVHVEGESGLNQKDLEKQELALYRKNKMLIDAIESLPTSVRDSAQDLIFKMRESYN
ncbi:MAG: hypothetical protein II814_01765 [Treponema sp.]|nr:hypothetical protein [Treponema sp.]